MWVSAAKTWNAVRWVVILPATAALGWIAGLIIVNASADATAPVSARQALQWDPYHPAALVRLAEERVQSAKSKADLSVAESLAQRALWVDPLQEPALRPLAEVAAARGDKSRIAALMRLAGARTQRDPFVQAWLANDRVGAGDYGGALQHIDAILRTQPQLGDGVMPALVRLAGNPAVTEPLARALANRPPWRTRFMTEFCAHSTAMAPVANLYAALAAGPSPPTDAEQGAYITRFINDGLYEQAYLAWLKTLPPARRNNVKYLYDGNFEYPTRGLIFEWMIIPTPGAEVRITPGQNKIATNVLKVAFSGARISFTNNVRELMLLAPGHYRLTGKYESVALRNSRGLWWRVYCAEHQETSLGASKLVTGAAIWRDFGMDFDVPAKGCRAQWMGLELPARIAAESQISGQISYAALAVSRRDGASQ